MGISKEEGIDLFKSIRESNGAGTEKRILRLELLLVEFESKTK